MNGTHSRTSSPSRQSKSVVAVLNGRKLMGFKGEEKARITDEQIAEAIRLRRIHRLSVELLVRSMRVTVAQAAMLLKKVQ